MKKIYLLTLFLLIFSYIVNAQDFPITTWSDSADISWYNENQDEFTLSSAEELAGVAALVAAGNTFEEKTIKIDANIDLDANLWTPIGNDIDHPFSGTFDGNDHVISNLWINMPDGDFIGLFGQCTGASLANIIMDTAHILANNTAGTLVGNFSTNGTIVNSHVINTSITATDYNIGGLVGGLLTDSSISQCSSSGDVTGESQVGGLVGSPWDKTKITQSYSEGTVSGDYLIGGLAGYCVFGFEPNRNNIVNNCYSRATVEAEIGRAGGIYGGSDGTLRLQNSYSTGTVSAPEFAGAVIGAWGGSDIVVENTYFDTETSGLTDGVGGFTQGSVDYNIEGKTTANMKTQEFVDLLNAGSDEAPWFIDEGLNDGYPVFNSSLSVHTNNLESPSVVVYPTTFDNQLNISTKLNLRSYRIYSYSGALVSQGSLEGIQTITPSNLASGIYILKISTNKGSITKKIIKK